MASVGVFEHWSARGVRLEVFLSSFHLGRSAQIAAQAAALLSLVTSLHAQTVVITGSREPLSPDRLAADVVVIDNATIRASTADSLGDLLRREAGMQLSRSGGPGHSSGVFIRGAYAGQTVVLVDGVRVGSATVGQPSLDGLALSQIDRIEVLRGPGSSLYGADAIGGVVQIFTRRGEAGTSFDAQAAVGGYGSVTSSAGIRSKLGAWDMAAALSHEKSDGVSTLRPGDQFGNYNPDRDGYQLDAAQAQIGFSPAPGQRFGLALLSSRLNVQYDASEFLPPTYAQDNTPDFRDHQRTEVATLDWRGALGVGLTGSANVSHSVDDSKSGGHQIDHFRTLRDHVGAQLAWNAGAIGQLVGAVEQGTDKASSTAFLADVQRRTSAFVLALTGEAGPWGWQTDVRRDDPSDFNAVTTARLGGGYTLLPGLRLRALAGTTFRAPSFNDLYYPGYGVTNLQPERGRSVEVGLNWRGADSEAALTVYRNRVRDLVAYEGDRSFCPADPAYDFGCARNINRAQLDGSSWSGRQVLRGALTLKAQVDFLTARDEVTGARLSRRAAHQETLGADWNGGAWNVGGNVLRLGARPDGGVQLAAETTLDLTAGWRFTPGWSLQAKLLNATNRATEPARDYQGLGRQAWLGLRFEGGL
jgi:vitamin B12 transporter